MARIAGKSSRAIVAGASIAALKGLTFTADGNPIDLDPDIGSTRITSVVGFARESATLNFNWDTSETDFTTLWDAWIAQSSVNCYIYPDGTGSSKPYVYGNVDITQFSINMGSVTSTVDASLTVQSNDTTGFNRQATAA